MEGGMKRAMLVSTEYLAMLEQLHAEMHQVSTAESVGAAKRYLRCALVTEEEISKRMKEAGG
jgi:hypothetical protein